MARGLPVRTTCAAPGVAKSHKNLDGLLGLIIAGWFRERGLLFLSLVAVITPIIIFVPCFGIPAFMAMLIGLLQEAKDWYYNGRLLCVDPTDQCVVGTIVHEPTVSFDGDRKMDCLLAPFTEADAYRAVATHLNANLGLLTNPTSFDNPPFFQGQVPTTPPSIDPNILENPNASGPTRRAERKKIADYLKVIRGEDPEDSDATSNIFNNFLVGVMDRFLDPNNRNQNGEPKNFQRRFYRKDPSVIDPTSALWKAIPHDHDPNVNWQATDGSISPLRENNPYEFAHQPRGLNPMFRFDGDRLTPYLHCEIDGYAVAVLLDQLSLALAAFGAAYFLGCLILGPLLGAAIGLALALLAFLLQWLVDGGSDAGDATEPDVDYDDPENFGEEGQQLDGDLVSIYGPWIMDTEHAQYLEIHPVKAYYIIGRNGRSEVEVFDTSEEQQQSGTERLHNGIVDQRMRDEICGLVRQAEEGDDAGPILLRDAPTALSHGLGTRWSGGGVLLQ
ncbi:MAG TPA: hypothetical protein VG095_01350 [Chthoniobacterales bacterium]|nr:hypothetical protein [Chthoniobacterales bacterium]